MDRHRLGRYTNRTPVYYPMGYIVPRVCSHCGAVHADDALALAKAGWELQDNRRLQPPGHSGYLERLSGGVMAHIGEYVRCPVPAVKVYAKHFTPRQLLRFNRVITNKYKLS